MKIIVFLCLIIALLLQLSAAAAIATTTETSIAQYTNTYQITDPSVLAQIKDVVDLTKDAQASRTLESMSTAEAKAFPKITVSISCCKPFTITITIG